MPFGIDLPDIDVPFIGDDGKKKKPKGGAKSPPKRKPARKKPWTPTRDATIWAAENMLGPADIAAAKPRKPKPGDVDFVGPVRPSQRPSFSEVVRAKHKLTPAERARAERRMDK